MLPRLRFGPSWQRPRVAEQRLSICMVTTFYPPLHFGGDAVNVQRQVHALARRGHEITVVHSADAHRALGGMDPGSMGHTDGVTLRALERRAPQAATLASYLSGRPALYGRELQSILGERDFDVVHFHNVSLIGGPDVLRYGAGVKLYTTHEHWLVCPMHVLFRDNREPCTEPHCLRCTLRFRRPPQLWRYTGLLGRSVPHVDLFLAPSRFTIEAHRARGFTGPMRRLPLFLPEHEVEDNGTGFDNGGRPYFLFVGRLERLKGVQVLLEVFRTYRAADLLIAGDGTYGDELRRTAAGLAQVRFLGKVAAAELDSLYRGATALIVPSIGYETFGVVGIEAMARRTPVIVNDLGALPELVADSGGGLVYTSTHELIEAMGQMQENPLMRQELGDRGYAAWWERWSEEPHMDAYFAAIDEARGLAV